MLGRVRLAIRGPGWQLGSINVGNTTKNLILFPPIPLRFFPLLLR